MAIRDIFIGSALTVISTISVQTFLYNKNLRVQSRNIVRHLHQLSKDVLKNAREQLQAFLRIVEKLQVEELGIADLSVLLYIGCDILANEVSKETTFSSFSYVLRQRIDYEENYIELKLLSNSMNKIFTEIINYHIERSTAYKKVLESLGSDLINIEREIEMLAEGDALLVACGDMFLEREKDVSAYYEFVKGAKEIWKSQFKEESKYGRLADAFRSYKSTYEHLKIIKRMLLQMLCKDLLTMNALVVRLRTVVKYLDDRVTEKYF